MKTHTLRFVALLVGFIFLAPLGARAAQAGEKYTFVLVHGATAGGWEWKSTGKFLTDDGHTVYRATLTGLGERMHLNSPDIDLQTHINDVVNLILFEDLHDIVLTGHSYGGMVITGVMDRVPDRIKHVVFLDAAVPDDGMSLWNIFGGDGPRDPERFKDGFMQVPWVKADRQAAAQRQAVHQVLQSARLVQEPRRPGFARDLRRLRPQGQVGRGAREDRQELAARGGAWLDDPHFSRRPRRAAGRSARRRDAHRTIGERSQQVKTLRASHLAGSFLRIPRHRGIGTRSSRSRNDVQNFMRNPRVKYRPMSS